MLHLKKLTLIKIFFHNNDKVIIHILLRNQIEKRIIQPLLQYQHQILF